MQTVYAWRWRVEEAARIGLGGVSLALAGLSVTAAPIQVYILAGQSNMEGRAHRRDLPAGLNGAPADVLFYFDAAWGPLVAGSSRLAVAALEFEAKN
ncbi:MAG: hypothetical protein EXS43_13515 [Opitutus sp.]|nr:hypothetical protein [Opitutus sp.]